MLVEPLIDPYVAVMVDVPRPIACASDEFPAWVPIVAMAEFEELQLTEVVKSCVDPSSYVPVAVNCCVSPLGTEGFAGVTAMDCGSGTMVAVTQALIVTPVAAYDRQTSELPPFSPTANPCVPGELLIVALTGFDELHDTKLVTFCVLPLLNVPVAINCSVVPESIFGVDGEILIDESAPTSSEVEPFTEPDVAVIVAPPLTAPAATNP